MQFRISKFAVSAVFTILVLTLNGFSAPSAGDLVRAVKTGDHAGALAMIKRRGRKCPRAQRNHRAALRRI